MLKFSDFDRALQEFSEVFQENGVKKISQKTYLVNTDVRLKFALDKWGWSPDDGLRFIIRLRNLKLQDSNGNMPYVDGEVDLTDERLFKSGLVDKKAFKSYIDSLPPEKTAHTSGWYRCYTYDDLIAIIQLIIKPTIDFARQWGKEQNKPSAKHTLIKPMAAAKWEQIQKQLRSIGESTPEERS
jgi:hypothetical protein